MSVDPKNVIRVTPPTGSDHELATNRDHTTGVGLLTAQDMSITTSGRLGAWMGHTMIVGAPADHGEVADEAAMLALHDWADDPHTRAVYHYVAPGDSCTRADDPGYRWHCLRGHGTALWQWERRPLAGPVAALEARADAMEIELAGKIGSSALDGYVTDAALTTALAGKAASTHTHALSQLTQSGAATGQVATWTGSAWAPADAGGGGGTTLPTPTVGQMLVCATAGAWTALSAPGVVGQVLTANDGLVPQWMLPATPWQAQVARWVARAEAVGGTFTASSQALADAIISAMAIRPWAGKIVALWPLLGGNLATALVPLIDRRAYGVATNTGFVAGDFSESSGLTGGEGKSLSLGYTPLDLGAAINGGLGFCARAQSYAYGVEPIGVCNADDSFRGVIDLRANMRVFRWGVPATGAGHGVDEAGGVGTWHGRRASASHRAIFRDGTLLSVNTTPDNAGGVPAAPIRAMASAYGSTVYPWYGRAGCWYLTDGTETDAEVADIYAFLQQYLITPTGR